MADTKDDSFAVVSSRSPSATICFDRDHVVHQPDQQGLVLLEPTTRPCGRKLVLIPSTSHVGVGNDDTEVAFAELQMLSQNQRKLATLTSRMTTILSGFDKRLIKLESSILPFTKGHRNLHACRQHRPYSAALNKTLGHYDVVIDEQPLLKQGLMFATHARIWTPSTASSRVSSTCKSPTSRAKRE